MSATHPFRKFERKGPSHQNAIDIFEGNWASNLAEVYPGVRSGDVPLFKTDPRPKMLADRLADAGRLDGMSVLELGPLEGAHTYQLEMLGAKDILAVESNVEAFLKCLIVKEIMKLRVARFMLGDFTQYLEDTSDRYDIVMCSGVLYHMVEPLVLIEKIARVTSKCFVWTHYFDECHYIGPAREIIFDPRYPGVKQYALPYGDVEYGRFWGGNQQVSVWLRRDDILKAFRDVGFTSIEIVDDEPSHPNGPSLTFAAMDASVCR